MHSINNLRKALGLASTNQVRNRIEAIKDVLDDSIRRGPNNQILVTDDGLDLLQRLQELYESGLTMAEASNVLRAEDHQKSRTAYPVSSTSTPNRVTPGTTQSIAALREEVRLLRQRLAALERSGAVLAAAGPPPDDGAWWLELREHIDAS